MRAPPIIHWIRPHGRCIQLQSLDQPIPDGAVSSWLGQHATQHATQLSGTATQGRTLGCKRDDRLVVCVGVVVGKGCASQSLKERYISSLSVPPLRSRPSRILLLQATKDLTLPLFLSHHTQPTIITMFGFGMSFTSHSCPFPAPINTALLQAKQRRPATRSTTARRTIPSSRTS